MKKYSILLVVALFSILFLACNSDKQNITQNAYGYLDAMGNYEIEEAMPYATEETKEVTLRYILDAIMPMTDTAYIASNTPANIEIVKVHLKSDSVAEVAYTKHTPIKVQKGTLEMHKCGEEWLAHVIIANKVVPSSDEQKAMMHVGDSISEQLEKGEIKIVGVEKFER